jgi:hypothetical protein
LDRSDLAAEKGELVSAKRLLSLIELASRGPMIVVLLCCYSDDALDLLASTAPFVVTSKCAAQDAACVVFTRGFYEHLLTGNSVQGSFQHAQSLLTARQFEPESFRLSRRSLIKRSDGVFIESVPDPHRDSILVNLDAVKDRLGKFGMSEAELLHMLARKLRVHSWIFDGANDHAIIPVGRLLFGEFTWKNAREIVSCTRLMRIRPDVPRRHWELWSRILTSYNDLAACAYRSAAQPAAPGSRAFLEEGILVFKHHINKSLIPALGTLGEPGYDALVPHGEWAVTAVENAEDQFKMGRYPQTVSALEMALTNFHEVANGLLPPEEEV